MSQQEDQVEERSVEMSELKAGVTLRAGHPVILLVGGVKGDPDPSGDPTGPVDPADPTAPAEPTGAEPTAPPAEDPTGDPTGDPGDGSGDPEPTLPPDPSGDPTGGGSTEPPGPTPSVYGKFHPAHFETAKSFPLPASISTFKEIAALMQKEPKRVLLVVGHTDSAGAGSYNLKLSEERAGAVKAYLENKVDPWLGFYSHSDAQKKWGTREDQFMLSALPFDSDKKYYTRAPSGTVNADFKTAAAAFQRDQKLPATAVNAALDTATRKKLILAYMQAEGTSVPESADVQTLACGERHLEVKTGDGVSNEENRRVEVFAFEGPIDPKPSDCSNAAHPGCSAYEAWKSKVNGTFTEPPAPPPTPKDEDPKPEELKPEEKKEEPKKDDPDAVKSREDYPKSPEDLRQRYLHMKFKIGDEEVEFTLDKLKYHNYGLKDKDGYNANPVNIGDRDALKQLVMNIKNKIKKDKGDDFYAELLGEFAKKEKIILPYPFVGKGAPAQIEAVLKIVGYVKGAGLGKYWNDKGSLSESLKDFYFNNMGLDCSGFAGNYARWIAGPEAVRTFPEVPKGLNPEMPISEFARAGKKRKKFNEIMMGDLMVWEDGSHIATILSHNKGDIECVESNGEKVVQGLGHKTRKVTEPSGGAIWMLNGTEKVYIVSFT